MAGNYSKLYLHFVFAVKGRQSLIPKERKEELHKYISGLVSYRKAKLLAVHCMPDHLHLFVGYQPSVLISDFVKEIKLATHAYILTNRIVRGTFAWQSGYGVFSYSHSQIDCVINYVKNQEIHHRKRTFREEYLELLEQFAIEYDSRYIFSPID